MMWLQGGLEKEKATAWLNPDSRQIKFQQSESWNYSDGINSGRWFIVYTYWNAKAGEKGS